ncbi:hypothetical protein KM192_01185 [Pediococcus pentosaceus]|uniref:hypothetical protein n=1 Tax=Pediococcus pentosaceus TaxID=1255 RepID=UPI001C92CEF7|nr:hypothetical protein [Pediococcus pentosaceus]MBY4581355.1 hypothetical protein [Pediococcus pentosaceus]
MTKTEMIQQLYDEISRQNTIYMSIIGGLITIFAIFQWFINERRLKNVIENKINKMVIDKYRLDEVMQKSFSADDFMTNEKKKRFYESTELFNDITSLITLLKSIESNSDSQSVVLQLIINKVNVMKRRSNDFPEYKHDFEELVRNVNSMDDSIEVIKTLKIFVNFTYNPSTIDKLLKKQTPK